MLQLILLILVAVAVLLAGSVTDVMRRTVSSYLFIPLFAAGIVFLALYINPPYWFYLVGILIFVASFMKTDLVIYPVAGVIFLVISLFLAFQVFIFGFDLLVMSAIFLMGFQERFFGIGDIKALIAISFSFITIPMLTPLTSRQRVISSFVPFSMALLINVAIFSIVFVPYMVYLNKKAGNKPGNSSIFALRYNQEMYEKNSRKFSIHEYRGKKYMQYRTPFMISITGGFILTLLLGFWIMFL
ncbi:hypothetical protein OXIME_001453 [Oxyplasma meridianum]|uniref:Prepilin type IV endopeptidase peptidase domain-containing protein n=1 Tax=Oxyplasma meridianum TaxID=3073602 RepID=A0AAX4NHQ4_9ARCH